MKTLQIERWHRTLLCLGMIALLPIGAPAFAATIFSEGFEGAFPPTSWYVGNNNSNTVAKWGDNSAKAHTGSWSAFCADNGSNSRTTYDNNLNTYMQRRNISLAGYTNATLTFWYWMNTESCCDGFEVNVRSQSGVWTNLLSIRGSSGVPPNWNQRSLNLNAYAGQTGLIISFDFVSDSSVVPSAPAGVWVDDVLLTGTASLPDLYISSGTPTVTPSTVAPGGTFSLSSWTVRNGGTGAANGLFHNGFYLSTNTTISTSDTYLSGNANSNLGAGASFVWGGPTLTIPAGTSNGDYYVGILVDRSNEIVESNEGNNYVYAPITVSSGADVEAISLSVSFPSGDPRGQHPTAFSASVRNNGPANVASGNDYYRYDVYLSTNSAISTSDTNIGNISVHTPMNVGQTYNWTASSTGRSFVTIPSDMPAGTYYVGTIVNPVSGQAPSDPDMSNNDVADGTVTIPGHNGIVSITDVVPSSWLVTGPAPAAGRFDARLDNQTNPNAIQMLVVGLRDANGNWVSGTGEPQVVLNDIPAANGENYNDLSFSVATKTVTSTQSWRVWVHDAFVTSQSAAVTEFKNAVPTANNNQNWLLASVTVNPTPLPTVQFSASSSSGSESTTSANLTVTLSLASGQTVTVNYAATGGTATSGGVDYTLANGQLSFSPGQTTKTIPITVVNDTLCESNETIQVTLSSPTNATLGSPSVHTYTITDNDCVPHVVRVVDTTIPSGQNGTVPIQLVAQGNENAIASSIQWDTTKLTYVSAALGSGVPSGATFLPNTSQTDQGRLGVVIALPAGNTFSAGTKELVRVTFTAAPVTGTTTVSFGDQPVPRSLSDANAQSLPATWSPGTVTFGQGYEADVAPRPNGDGQVLVNDLVQEGRFVAGLDPAPAPGSEFQRADCAPRGSNDGRILVTDLVQAGRYVARLDPVEPAGGPSSPAKETQDAVDLGQKNEDGSASEGEDGDAKGARELIIQGSTVSSGANVVVPIVMDMQGDENAVGFSVCWDASKLTYVSFANGADLPGNATVLTNTSQTGQGSLGIVIALTTGTTFSPGVKQLAVLTFTAANVTGIVPTAVSFCEQPVPRSISDANAQALTATWTPGTVTINGTQQVATPQFSPAPGTYNSAQDVTITCATSGATIRYTTDGSEPSATSPTYSAALHLTSPTTLKAKGFKSGYTASQTTSGFYDIIIQLVVATPTFSPASGTTPVDVTISCTTAGATIRYTTDGSEPSGTSSVYNSPIHLTTPTTLKAKGFKSGYTSSSTAVASYGGSTREVNVVDTTIGSGQNGTVLIELAAQGDENALAFSVQWDTTKLTCVSAVRGTDVPGDATFLTNTSAAAQGRLGIVIALGAGETLTAGTRELAEVTFTAAAVGVTEQTTVSFGDQPVPRSISDANAQALTATWTPGTVTIGVVSILTDRNSVTVPENGTATFRVKLSALPQLATIVSVYWVSGDSDISVQSGSSLTFTSNWNTYQTVTLRAAEDADMTNGTATIRCSATGLANKDVTATEQDNDTWHSESVSWRVNYGNCWNRSGTVTKPGATRIRLHFGTINVETGWDELRSNVGDSWSGDYSNIASGERSGNSITLTLTSDESVTGYFIIDRVDYQGTSGGAATRTGSLFTGGAGDDCPPPPPPSIWEGGKTLQTEVKEEVLPLALDGDPTSKLTPMNALSLRLSAEEDIDLASVWAMIETSVDVLVPEAKWRVTDPADGTDGWVMLTMAEPLPVGEVVTVTVGARTVGGEEVGPVSQQFSVGSDDVAKACPCHPQLGESTDIEPLPELLAAPTSPVYRIEPTAVFSGPVTLQIPVPDGSNPEELDIYYFSESERHRGWFLGENVIGWIVPDSRTVVEENGQTYIQIEVNHSGVLQLGHAIKVQLGSVGTLDVGITGERWHWAGLAAGLAVLMLMTRRRTKRLGQ